MQAHLRRRLYHTRLVVVLQAQVLSHMRFALFLYGTLTG